MYGSDATLQSNTPCTALSTTPKIPRLVPGPAGFLSSHWGGTRAADFACARTTTGSIVSRP